jgi:cardiolipin synthase
LREVTGVGYDVGSHPMRRRPNRPPRTLRGLVARGAVPTWADAGGLHAVSTPAAQGPRVLGSGEAAFAAILARIAQARRSIEVRAFLWRDDATGNALGQALLDAADRGVTITIHKDRIAAVYEYAGGNKQSFFHKRVDPIRGVQAWFLGAVNRNKGSFRQRPNALAEAILSHRNITVEHLRKRFDHSKLFIVDDRALTLGSMNIGDNHHKDWVDIMVDLEGEEHIARLRERLAGLDEFDPSRGIDFLVHSRSAHRAGSCPMLSHRLALIDAARVSLTIEMAYLGDRRYTAAMARAVHRGVELTLVTASRADVLGNLNRATCDVLMRLTGAPSNLSIVLLPRMVHSKIVVIDHRFCDVGSANFTPLSHGVYDEINLYADSEPFALALEAEIARHCEEGRVASHRIGYRRVTTQIEKAIVAYQSRKGG